VALLKDEAVLTIDTSGAGLHKRGYRSLSAPAPLRETLASVMLTLSNWRPQYPLVDPCCGSGTILIEAVMKALNLAPGLGRSFAAQEWPQISPSLWDSVREEARDLARSLPELRVEGYDLDPEVLSLARYHARQAGAEAHIHFQRRALTDFKSAKKYGSIITNPVYGHRMEDPEAAGALYLNMGKVFQGLDTWSVYILTSHPDFELLYGRKASKTRKLYNGRIECRLYQYHGPRPKRQETQVRCNI
jgi:putative N6-adenine-specific DNA methylase